MHKRIDFDMFKPAEKVSAGGGLLCKPLRHLLSEDMNLQTVVKLIEKDAMIMWVSEANWSMHELLLAILDITGPGMVYISSYAMSETAARTLAQLKDAGMITLLNCLLDNRVDVRSAGSLQLMKSICDELALIDTHAKVTVVQNENWKLAVVGSANYTENKRYESGIITLHPPDIEFQLTWMIKAMTYANC